MVKFNSSSRVVRQSLPLPRFFFRVGTSGVARVSIVDDDGGVHPEVSSVMTIFKTISQCTLTFHKCGADFQGHKGTHSSTIETPTQNVGHHFLKGVIKFVT